MTEAMCRIVWPPKRERPWELERRHLVILGERLGEVQLIRRREDPKSSHLLPKIDIKTIFFRLSSETLAA